MFLSTLFRSGIGLLWSGIGLLLRTWSLGRSVVVRLRNPSTVNVWLSGLLVVARRGRLLSR